MKSISFLAVVLFVALVFAPIYSYAEGIQSNEASYTYDPEGKRDPFRPLVEEKEEIAEPDIDRPEKLKGPLEKYELSQFRLMAIVVVNGVPNAMVSTPDGRSYRVKEGDYIGIKSGQVLKIETRAVDADENGLLVEKNPDRIVVEETGYDRYTKSRVTEKRFITM